ncbi:MAG: hypothetical protein AB1499_17450, partial [Nitrospirota bacterium]
WAGEAGFAENRSLPLTGIYFIRHGSDNRAIEVNPGEAMKRLMPVISMPLYDREAVSGMLSFCEDIVSHVPAYELYFKPDGELFDFLEKTISA